MLLGDPEEPAQVVEAEPVRSMSPLARNILLAIAALYIAGSSYFLYDMRTRLAKAEAGITAADVQQNQTADDLKTTHASVEALSTKLGMTSEELAKRTQELSRAQAQAAAKLSKAQQEQGEELTKVSGDVSNVKTDLGGAKTDIATTKTDLEDTKKKLESTIGDLNVQSGLIAHTRDDLEFLKHKGDRNIYEFTLAKGHSQPVSTVSLELKKADRKKGKFTMNVIADDRTIEKKDRTIFEPMQFYTGRDRLLYEVVVMSVDKDKITGYLSAPKSAPTPLSK